jgi:hypothetical protein
MRRKIQILDNHKKRDLIEEIERIEIQKQIEQERSIPSDLEISHLEIKDHPYQVRVFVILHKFQTQ